MPLGKSAASHRMTTARLQRLGFAVAVSARTRSKHEPSLLMTRQRQAVVGSDWCAERRYAPSIEKRESRAAC
jgi:hypothetical protein